MRGFQINFFNNFYLYAIRDINFQKTVSTNMKKQTVQLKKRKYKTGASMCLEHQAYIILATVCGILDWKLGFCGGESSGVHARKSL